MKTVIGQDEVPSRLLPHHLENDNKSGYSAKRHR